MPNIQLVDHRLELPGLHPGQQMVHDNMGRFTVIRAGRRWGKTEFCKNILVDDPGWGLTDGYPVAWYAGKESTFLEVWEAMDKWTRDSGLQTGRDGVHHRIETYGGGILEFWSLHNGDDGGIGRGRKYRQIIVDEAAYAKDLLACWSKAMRFCLVDLRGRAAFISTPNKFNDFKTLDDRGYSKDPAYKHWRSFHQTSYDNPYLPPDELAELEAEYVGRPYDLRQEVYAEYIKDVGQIFKTEWIVELADMPLVSPCYQAWDVAVSEKQVISDDPDWSVGVTGGLDSVGRFMLTDLVRGRWDAWGVAKQILDAARKHDPHCIWIESNGPGKAIASIVEHMMVENKKRWRVELVTSVKDKVARAASTVGEMASGNFHLPREAAWKADLLLELVAFPPEKDQGHDDQVDALSILTGKIDEMRETKPQDDRSDRKPGKVYYDDMMADYARRAEELRARTRGRRR